MTARSITLASVIFFVAWCLIFAFLPFLFLEGLLLFVGLFVFYRFVAPKRDLVLDAEALGLTGNLEAAERAIRIASDQRTWRQFNVDARIRALRVRGAGQS